MLDFIKKKQVWIPVVAILILAVLVSLFRGEEDRERIDFSEVLAAARAGEVGRIEVRETRLDVWPRCAAIPRATEGLSRRPARRCRRSPPSPIG